MLLSPIQINEFELNNIKFNNILFILFIFIYYNQSAINIYNKKSVETLLNNHIIVQFECQLSLQAVRRSYPHC